MACNCKKSIELQEKYGVEQEVDALEKLYMVIWKVFLSVIVLAVSVIAVPVMMAIIIFNIMFGNGKPVAFPKQLGKYLK